MKISSRCALACSLLTLACLAGCAVDPAQTRSQAPPNDARALAADLNARLDALQHQSEPASDDVIASLERTLREQREKRARAVVAAGTTSVIPTGSAAGVAAPTVPLKPAVAAPVSAPVAVAAAASMPSRPVHLSKAQARAASAAAARQAATARQSEAVVVATAEVPVSTGATALAPMHSTDSLPLPRTTPTNAATITGPARTPMSRTSESHQPVEDLYARARDLEVQLQVVPAIALYREASQRGHAASSQRLMELYADGAPGVARDYRVAVFFKERAVQQGASFDPAWRH
jgi:hypothetical protein